MIRACYICVTIKQNDDMKKTIFSQYLQQVIDLYGVPKDIFLSGSRNPDASEARYMLYYLCHKRGMRVTQIQKYMAEEGYDPSHCSVGRGIKNITNRILDDRDYETIVDRIENKIFI